jgi:hypothetical protein
MRRNSLSQRGQVVLVILLVVSVILVVGLSAVSRSVTDIKLSQQTQESARALLVAQAGLEKAIKANASISSETDSELNVQNEVVKRDLGGSSETEFIFPEKLKAGEYVSFWFLPHKADGSLDTSGVSNPKKFKIVWGSDKNTALEATIIYQSSGKFYTQRYVYGPDSINGEETYFQNPSTGVTIDGITFQSSSGEIFFDGVNKKHYLMQLRLLFNSSPEPIGIISNDGSSVYQQGSCFTSTATVLESGITRKFEQCQLWSAVPSIFNYLLFSGQSIGGGV